MGREMRLKSVEIKECGETVKERDWDFLIFFYVPSFVVFTIMDQFLGLLREISAAEVLRPLTIWYSTR